MRVLSVAYGARGHVEPMVGLAVQLRASGVEVQMPAEGWPERAAALVATTYDAVAAVAEGCDAVVATGLFPAAAPSSRNTRTLEPWRPEPATAARDFPGPDTLPCATVAGGLASELIT
ncbi:hypothetical protein ACFVXE_33350 [Streptomyces sp. NPDC058231]|uniref:hypothetical protein n=1 Tax=Streptomyces sp. NPDC058231 TaxID=3346392 RepID=UPI0036E895E7